MTRAPLPNRRRQDTFEIRHEGHVYSVSVGQYASSEPGEVFIQAHKVSTPLEAVARDAAILLSLAIQYGIPIAQLRQAVTRDGQGEAATIIGAVLDGMEEGP